MQKQTRFKSLVHGMPLPVVVLIGGVIGVIMLYFGLRFKGYQMDNHAQWLSSGDGLYFDNYSTAFTDAVFTSHTSDDTPNTGLGIVLAVRFEEISDANFRYILSVNNGNDADQLLVGQWRRWLVIMNGDDYDGKRKEPKVYVDIGDTDNEQVLLGISSDSRGTVVYLNGQVVKSNRKLHLHYPHPPNLGRLVLANSVHGAHSWRGTLFGIALYDASLSEPEILSHYQRWGPKQDFYAALLSEKSAIPKICYVFNKRHGTRELNDLAGDGVSLQIPAHTKVLQKTFLRWPNVTGGTKWHLLKDMIANLVGFMPLGAILCIVFYRCRLCSGRRSLFLAMGIAFVFSLSMEIGQAWIPSRDSSSLDLLLNTLGAGLGSGLIYRFGELR